MGKKTSVRLAGAVALATMLLGSAAYIGIQKFSTTEDRPCQENEQGVISRITLPAAVVGRAYARRLTAEGGSPPYSFALVGDKLDAAGLSLESAGGTLTGTPIAPGEIEFKVSVRDGGGVEATQCYKLRIHPSKAKP